MVKTFTHEQVVKLARETLSVENESYRPPEVYVTLLTSYLQKNPYDTHFIIELATSPDKGGANGCGVVTCMEESCWLDVHLTTDPKRPNGGKDDGIGSLWEYQVHCTEPKHVQARNARCKGEGKDMSAEERLGSAAAPLSVLDELSPSPPPITSIHHSRPNAMASSSKIEIDLSSSDDEVEVVELTPFQKLRLEMAQQKKKQKAQQIEEIALGRSSPAVAKTEMVVKRQTVEAGPSALTALADREADYASRYGLLLREIEELALAYDERKSLPAVLPHRMMFLRRMHALQAVRAGTGIWVPAAPIIEAHWPATRLYTPRPGFYELAFKQWIAGGGPGRNGLATDVDVLRPGAATTSAAAIKVEPHFNEVFSNPLSHRLADPASSSFLGGEIKPWFDETPSPSDNFWRPVDPVLGADYTDEEENHPHFGRYGRRPRALAAGDMKEFFEKSMDDLKDDVTVEDALQKLNLQNSTDKLPGMEISLMPHQVIGVAWMTEQERKKKYAGGILADAMGLGKTVQTIATMVVNRSENPRVQTTLIIAPLALLAQWKEEIETKTEEGLLRVLIHHGSNRTKSYKELRKYDVVLTTYGTLVGEWPKPISIKKKKKTIAEKINNDFVIDDSDFGDSSDDEARTLYQKRGPLFHADMNFLRIVLDEAHNIRNKSTQASKAVMELNAEYRWSLTGTLIINSLDDIYPHLHFTGISAQADWTVFRTHITSLQRTKPKTASKRAQAILRPCMLRRTKDSKIGDQPIFTLPPKLVEVEMLEFNDEERAIYNAGSCSANLSDIDKAVETRAKVRFNKFLKSGTVLKHYHVVLVLLMRLKQLTCHPWLIRRKEGEEGHQDDMTVGEDDDLMIRLDGGVVQDEVQRAVGIIGQAGVDKIKEKLGKRAEALMTTDDHDGGLEECPICCMCLICAEIPAYTTDEPYNEERITPCLHSFCRGCIEDVLNSALRDAVDLNEQEAGRALQQNMRPCPICRAEIDPGKVFNAAAFEPPVLVDYEDDDEGKGGNESQAEEASDDENYGGLSLKAKGKRKMKMDDDEDIKPRKLSKARAKMIGLDDIMDELAEETEKPPRSTKMKRMVEIIQAAAEEDPSQKILIFSQFTSFLDLVSKDLFHQGIPHELYVGSMRQSEREAAIKAFVTGHRVTDAKIMLISLKCGGVGLNLTCANKVISLDLAWNEATERQAWDRAHRIGQTRPVTISRLVVNNTVEQRILDMQRSKQSLADGAFGEGEGGKLGRLTVDDLMMLFDVNGDEN